MLPARRGRSRRPASGCPSCGRPPTRPFGETGPSRRDLDQRRNVERFLADAARGLAAHRTGLLDDAWEALSTAESRYTGEFLEENAYEGWASGLREEARNVYISVAFTLAGLAGDRADHDAVTRYLYRVLARDPYDERAHLALISSLETAGRRGDSRRAYKVYLRRMEEIDVDPQDFPQSGVRRLRAV